MSIMKISSAVSKYRTIVNGKKLWNVFNSSTRLWIKLKLIKKQCALKLINKFVTDFSVVYGARLLKRFKYYRHMVFKHLENFIMVTRARCELVGLYWDKVEKAYRKQHHDAAIAIEKQKRKELAAYLKTLDKNSIEGKWNLVNTHQQQFMFQVDNVQGQYQRAAEGYFKEPGFNKWTEIKTSMTNKLQNTQKVPGEKDKDKDKDKDKKKESTRPIDMMDPNERYKIIREEIRKKREVLKGIYYNLKPF